MAEKPTNKFSIPTNTPLKDMEGEVLTEPHQGGKRPVTLGMVLAAAMLSDAKVEGVTLALLDRLELARRFRDKPSAEIKVATNEAVKKLVAEAYKHSPLVAGQALELLGDEPSKDL